MLWELLSRGVDQRWALIVPVGGADLVRELVHSRMEGLVHNNIRWHAAAWELPSEQSEKPISYDWQDRGASLILISLLSLGLWAAIWVAVALWLLAVSG